MGSTGPTGESTVPIMAFNHQQRVLLPPMTNHSLIAQCCAIKAYAGWHANDVANKTRERCGGQGFLSANRFGLAITGTHSSITAEGDNSILMMKTVQEIGKDLKMNKEFQQ